MNQGEQIMQTPSASSDLVRARKHLSMVTAAHSHLGLGGKLANASRIREAQAVVESLEVLADVIARDGGYYTDAGAFVAVER
jgi:hypothetical protein